VFIYYLKTYRARYREEKATFDEEKREKIKKLSEKEKAEMKTEAELKRKRRSIRRRKKVTFMPNFK